MDPSAVARLGAWYAQHRRDLPWRRTGDPWAILLSEVLLQQTRVETGIPAFERLLRQFPHPAAMAAATEAEVLQAWSGLGYYRRARNLHATAKALVEHHGGEVPRDPAALAALPGIGPYTAAAVRAFAFDAPAAPLDANVLRVMARLTAEAADIASPAARARLAEAVLAVVRHGRPSELGQALMELGALVCLPAPRCGACPLAGDCRARAGGLERDLPRKKPKAAPKAERWAFARVLQGGKVLLEQRGPGLLEGFWALPGAPVRRGQGAAEALEERLVALGVPATVGAPAAKGRWAFTHRTWHFTVHPARVRARREPVGAAWVALDRLGELPLAQPHRAHLAALRREGL